MPIPAETAEIEVQTDESEIYIRSLLESSDAEEYITEVVQGLLKPTEEENERSLHIAEKRDHPDVHVEFEANTWSSFYLFFVTLEDGRGVYTKFEQCSIIATIVITWFVQGLLIVVIWLNMTENPFNQQIIFQILRFRILHGHSFAQVQGETGKTYMDVFCNEDTTPWSWEAEQYETISKYLDGVIPGWTLTVLALVGWVCCCASEFRLTVAQALATVNLKNPRKLSRKTLVHLEEEEMHVVSLTYGRKFCVLSLISLPRLVIMLTLLYTGCVYLCNTASLEDLVLNAMALIFVIEFDELVYAVCVTARAQKIVASVQPMTFPVYQLPGGLVLKDMIRLIFCLVAIVLSCTQLLLPFIDSISAARDALCGGDTALSYQAHTPLSFIHVLQHNEDLAQCPSYSNEYQAYMQDMYKVSLSGENRTNPLDPSAVQDDRIKLLLEFVYRDDKKEEMPDALASAMGNVHAELGVGSSAQPETCSRFDASKGIETCREGDGSHSEKACAWSYRSYLCEGWPSFAANRIKAAACATKPLTNFSCALWEVQNQTNPFTKCRAERISGSFTVNYGWMTPDEVIQLQGGLEIIDKSFIYLGVLGKFVGWTGVTGEVRQQEGRRLQAKSARDRGGVQVQLQLGSVLERRLGHQSMSEVRFTLDYDILIPFPNTGFILSTLAIYEAMSGLASSTSNTSRAKLVDKFEQEFSQLTSKQFSKGCLLSIDNASVPTWTALDTDLVAENPEKDDNAECSREGQCVNLHGWELNGMHCGTFESQGWCSNGGQGKNWDANMLNLSDVVANGVSVVSACCACGGGTKATSSSARLLNEALSPIPGKENRSVSNILFQSPVSTEFAVSSEAARANILAAAAPAEFAAATSQGSSSSSTTASKQTMEHEQRHYEDSLDLKALLTRLAALEQKNVALESALAVLAQKNGALESELAGIRGGLGGVKAAPKA